MARFHLSPLANPVHLLRTCHSRLRLLALTLFYNEHLSWTYVFDTALEPMLWLVDTFAKAIGTRTSI